jgi:hypothetical protein
VKLRSIHQIRDLAEFGVVLLQAVPGVLVGFHDLLDRNAWPHDHSAVHVAAMPGHDAAVVEQVAPPYVRNASVRSIH